MTGARLLPFAVLAGLVALAGIGGCTSGSPYSLSDDGFPLPATLLETLRFANSEALLWSENARVSSMGGGFTVLDGSGRGRNQTFVFHARDGQSWRRLDMHLFSGVPYQTDRTEQPISLLDVSGLVDTDIVVPAAINIAEGINAVFPDSLPATPEHFAARLSSRPAWPEPPNINDPADSVAWRVDFLISQVFPASGAEVWWSTARFYFSPRTGQLYGTVIPDVPVLYPYPNF